VEKKEASVETKDVSAKEFIDVKKEDEPPRK
jgi:hypothetical protein